MDWQPARSARRPAHTNARDDVLELSRSEGICDSGGEELAGLVVGFDDGGAGEEDAVAEGERDVGGDLPVDVEVGLPAEVALVEGFLVDGGIALQLVVNEEI